MSNQQVAELAELAGGFIHDIKNHLSTIGLNLQLLAEDFQEPQSQRERRALDRVQRLQGECQRLVDVSNDFLRYARVKDLHRTPTDLSELIDEMVDFFGPMARAGAIEIKCYVPANLPPVPLDCELFKQALLNLLLNAQQAMPQGGEVTIQATSVADAVLLSVIDTGNGMTAEELGKAFKPFYSTRNGGTGLGLPTTRRIIEAHGGSITAESEVGKGTRFTIRLPRTAGPGNGQGQAPAATPAPLANVNGQILPLSEVKVSVQDRAFLFGDSVYEVLRVHHGRPWLLDDHWARLERSLKEIRIAGVDLAQLQQRMRDTIAAGPFHDAMVYIQITRGAAPRTHAFPTGVRPLELLWVQEIGDPYVKMRREGIGVVLQPDLRWGRCDIKSTNLLANVLANQAAREEGGSEALLYLPDGTLTEGSHTSLFGVCDGRLRTSPNSPEILPGRTRGLVLRLAKQIGIAVEERPLNRAELERVSELFVTGTTWEIMPVVRVEGRPVGEGQPGPVTRRLQEAYQEKLRQFVAEARAEGGRPG
jgi:D-alanine transaminase